MSAKMLKRVLFALCCFITVALVTSCGSSTPDTNPNPDLVNFIEYTVEPGYGRDENSNTIIDMPNSLEYVQRPLWVNLDFITLAELYYPSQWPIPEGGDPGFGKLDGPWRWTLTPQNVLQDIPNLPVPTSTIANATPINDGTKLIAYTDTPILDIELFEGDWNVELARANPNDPAGDAIYWKTVPLKIEDYLIVQLGDSYSSGEGAPEGDSTWGIWGDDGRKHPLRHDNHTYFNEDFATCFQIFPFDRYAANECAATIIYGSTENLEHELAHRSSKTWGSIAAIEVENYDPHTSVTYINLAASGARIEHLLGNYKKPMELLPGYFILPSNYNFPNELRTGDGTITGPPYTILLGARPLPPQLAQMRDLVGNRKVDAVIMSFGGNDVGFSAAIVAYIVRDSDESFTSIENALANGDWSNIKYTGWEAWVGDYIGDKFPARNRAGFDDLANQYHVLDTRLKEIPNLLDTEIYIAEYPDPLVTSHYGVLDHYNAEVCPGPILTEAPLGEIGKGEQIHARQHIIIPLNQEIARSAITYNWNLVNIATSIYGNPICSDERMVNRYEEADARQGDHAGTVHPNEKGYRAMADALLRVLHLPNEVRSKADRFGAVNVFGQDVDGLKSPGSGYSPFPVPQFWAVYTLPPNPPPPDGWQSVSDWGTFGIEFSSERVFLHFSPLWCDPGEHILILGRTPVDFAITFLNEYWKVVFGKTLPSPYLQLVVADRWPSDYKYPPKWQLVEPTDTAYLPQPGVTALTASFVLEYTISEADRDKVFYAVLTTKNNATSLPMRGARVTASSSYLNDFGLIQLRTECGTIADLK